MNTNDIKLEEEKTSAENTSNVTNAMKATKAKWPFAVILIISIIILLYVAATLFFRTHFLPGTEISSVVCDYKTAMTVATELEQVYLNSYSLTIEGRDKEVLATIMPKDISLSISLDDAVNECLNQQKSWAWIGAFFTQSKKNDVELHANVELGLVVSFLEQTDFFNMKKGIKAENAYIGEYNEKAGCYEIIPETPGTILDKDLTIAAVQMALDQMQETVDLEELDCYKKADILQDNDKLQECLKEMNQIVGSVITYDWNGNEIVLDGETIHTWLSVNSNKVTLDETMVQDYVSSMAKEYDTYGKNRKFLTMQGIELTLRSGAYGWKTDKEAELRELLELLYAGEVTEKEPIYSSQGYVKGINDIGSSYIEIDLSNQHLYVVTNGVVDYETDFVSGNISNGNSTPAGVFGLTYKTTNAVLRGDDYETPVSYWMPFNGNIGMHDATWRRSFGGEIYLKSGSHGCVNLPLDAAKTIYGYVSTGFPIICYYY